MVFADWLVCFGFTCLVWCFVCFWFTCFVWCFMFGVCLRFVCLVYACLVMLTSFLFGFGFVPCVFWFDCGGVACGFGCVWLRYLLGLLSCFVCLCLFVVFACYLTAWVY